MKKLYALFLITLSLGISSVCAQQVPNSGFEDWSGAAFNGNIQLASWQSSNVEQTYMGITARANMLTRVSEAHSGQYAAYVKNTKVEVAGIGEVSPAWLTLGTPFSDITNGISGATAGTYGGINWTYCPDTMQVWIKRTYGSVSSDEIFSLVYYSWKGTSKASSYKAKNGSCVTIAEKINEESDIRQTNDPNGCGTTQYATQIGEGWFYQKAAYNQWTLIKVPITYFSDEAPEKMNIILSGGNYPNFRANDGIYEGNGIYVDDLSLIYSSCAHEMYVGNKQFKGFSPNVYTYTYSLGNGVTSVPAIFLKRSGRKLSSQEVTITNGQVDGAPTTITIRAQDGSSTTTYTVYFVSATSNNARLSDIQVNGTSLPGFNAYLSSYSYALPYGTTQAPVVTVTKQDAGATTQITQAQSPAGLASIAVTAQDGVTKQNYSVQFSVAQLSDNTLQNILVDGVAVPGFNPAKSNYTISLPLGTTVAPQITPVSAYPAGEQTISVGANSLADGCQIVVSAPGAASSKTYRITYKIEASSCSSLSAIMLDGVALEGFSPAVANYSVSLPIGTTAAPAITWTAGDPYQTISFVDGGLTSTSKIVVTAASGAQTTYKINFSVAKSSNCSLAAISVNGTALSSFHPDTLSYVIPLPVGTTSAPAVVATAGDADQSVVINSAGLSGATRITVKAADGTMRVYTLLFDVQKSENAFLKMIYLNGDSLEGFMPSVLEYTIVLSSATAPLVSFDKEAGQTVSLTQPLGYGTASIVVTPEEGEPNIYRIVFAASAAAVPVLPSDSLQPSHDATLRGILLGGVSLDEFTPSQHSYVDSLAWRTLAVPSVMPLAAAPGQTITVTYGAVGATTRIHVVAEDGDSASDYYLSFPVRKSSNSLLADLVIDGVDFVFNALQTEYDIVLPYGTAVLPSITPEKAEVEQSLEISTRGVNAPSTVLVRAEDGSTTSYILRFSVTKSSLPNVLQNIAVDGYGLIDLTSSADSVFSIDMPYGTLYPKVVSYTKNFAEQTVVVEQGGTASSSIVRVCSHRAGEMDKVYTIVANVPQHDPAYLTSLSVDGVAISGFSPDIYNYVVSVSGVPTVTYTASAESDADISAQSIKQVQITVENGDYSHIYTISFFYPGDFSFSQDFESWNSYTNSGASSGNVGEIPAGWHTPLDAAISDDKGTYYPADAVDSSSKHSQGTKGARLRTTYLLTSAESMPGILSLSTQTTAVGYWALGVHTASSLGFGNPVTFRNTPDRVSLDYNPEAANKVTGWHFIYKKNGSPAFTYVGSYAKKDQWQTVTQDITYADGFVPSTLDMIISSSDTEAPADYYVGINGATSSNRYTSTLYVDNLQFYYNSTLSSVLVDGNSATISGNTISAVVDAEYVGTPQLTFVGEVPDQGQTVQWQPWQNGQRTATITNYAEDGSSTVYTLTLTRPASSCSTAQCTLVGNDLSVLRGSAYQSVAVQQTDTAFVVVITAETGAEQTYVVPVAAWIAANAATHSSIASESLSSAPSTGLLSELTVDEALVPGFASDVYSYNILSAGNYAAQRECPTDSLLMILTDSLITCMVYDSAQTLHTYSLHLSLSANTALANIMLDSVPLQGFYDQTFFYSVSVSGRVVPEAVKAEAGQSIKMVEVNSGDSVYTFFFIVRAENGSTAQYCVQETVRTLSQDASLADFCLGGISLPGFSSSVTSYQMSQPAGYQIPDVSVVVAGENATAVITSVTQASTTSVTTTITVLVTAEAGNTQSYTLTISVLPSSENHLEMIYLDAVALTGFDPLVTSYDITLPVGTKTLPAVDYLKADAAMTVEVDSAAVVNSEAQVLLTCTAANGDVLTYTLHFTVLKSSNANLSMIFTDGNPLPGFDEDLRASFVHLSYGAPYPEVTYALADSAATAVLSVSAAGDSVTITVTAEDGVTTLVYTLVMDHLPSENALLQMIYLNGDSLPLFEPEQEDYTIILPYGTTELPSVTYTKSDEQQSVLLSLGNPSVLLVTAGDGLTTQEYQISYTYALSDNNYLSDLRLSGQSVKGFSRDKLTYGITYPVGSTDADFYTAADVVAVPEDSEATVSVSAEADGTLTIMVVAPNGDVRVYVVEQTILLSSNSLLRMIWMDNVEIKDFDPATLTYTYLLQQGAIAPVLTAEAQDSLAEVFITQATVGDTAYIYCDAQDGSETVYKVLLTYSDINAGEQADVDDCIFLHIVGSDQYMAITIRNNVQVVVCDHYGHRLYLEDVPVVDPNYVRVEEDSNGNQYIAEVFDGANGALFTVPGYGKTYFAVFFRNGKRKVAKGTKFSLNF